MSNPKVSFITVNFNQLEVTIEMIQSIYDTTTIPFEIIVVDNDSKVDPKPRLDKEFPEVLFVQTGGNLGFAKANNAGIDVSAGEYLFFVNNDTELTKGLALNMVNFLTENPKVGALSPLICYFPDGEKGQEDIIQYVGTTALSMVTARNETLGEKQIDKGQFKQAAETAYAHGAAMMVPRTVMEKVGQWPDAFFLYYEELDWCAQIKRAGYQIYVLPSAKIYHKESLTIGAESPLKVFYLNRNRVLFMRRNYSFLQLIPYYLFLWFFTYPKNIITYLLRGKPKLMKAFNRGIWWNIFPNSVGDPYLPK